MTYKRKDRGIPSCMQPAVQLLQGGAAPRGGVSYVRIKRSFVCSNTTPHMASNAHRKVRSLQFAVLACVLLRCGAVHGASHAIV